MQLQLGKRTACCSAFVKKKSTDEVPFSALQYARSVSIASFGMGSTGTIKADISQRMLTMEAIDTLMAFVPCALWR